MENTHTQSVSLVSQSEEAFVWKIEKKKKRRSIVEGRKQEKEKPPKEKFSSVSIRRGSGALCQLVFLHFLFFRMVSLCVFVCVRVCVGVVLTVIRDASVLRQHADWQDED